MLVHEFVGCRDLIMSKRSIAVAFFVCAGLMTINASAQEKRVAPPPNPVAVGMVAGHAIKREGAASGQLNKMQLELIQQVNAYFNQMTSLKGSFVQTSADNKRLRGKFYILRPGRFRFDFSPPSKLVMISDGQNIAIQDHDLKTDDRWSLAYTPFRALFQKNVDLLRDAHVFEVQEVDDTIVVVFEDKSAEAASRIKLFLSTKPAIQLKAWITKDMQGYDTRIDLSDAVKVDTLDASLFNPAAVTLERSR
jgi:outer membrane lipoprotein-sorting protein